MSAGERRLLVLSYFYPPLGGGGVPRVLGLTRHLPAHGWRCTVVCAGEGDYWVRDDSLRIPEGTEVIRVHGGSALSAWLKVRKSNAAGRRSAATFGVLRRLSDWWLLPDSYRGWARRAERAAARRIARGGIDALLTTSPPDSVHLAGLALASRSRLPWLADFRDPWIGLHFRTPPSAWHRARHEAMEAAVVETAGAVLAASRTHAGDLTAHFPARAAGIHHLPNGWERAGEGAPQEPADPDHFSVVFTGTLAHMPDAEVFLDALHDVLAHRPEGRRRVRVRFVGPYETGVEDRAIALGLKGIVDFLGPVPHERARALQRGADLLLLLKPAGEGYRTMVPGKLYEYLESGRPILAVLRGGEEAAMLAREGGATVVEPGQRAAVVEAFEGAYDQWRASGRAPRREVPWLAAHARSALAGRAAAILDSLVAR
jgi:glycosyltransferase involved in cell wall biosynthesis